MKKFLIRDSKLLSQIKNIINIKWKANKKYVLLDLVISAQNIYTPDLRTEYAFTPDGDLIGDPKAAQILITQKGIKPELRRPIDQICSIGWSSKTQMYYGWTFGKIRGFKVNGKPLESGDILTDILEAGYFPQSKEDCKQMAILFVELASKEGKMHG